VILEEKRELRVQRQWKRHNMSSGEAVASVQVLVGIQLGDVRSKRN
jgi:hypothetical protein